MNKRILTVFLILFLFSFLPLLAKDKVEAAVSRDAVGDEEIKNNAVADPVKKSEYTLPYPGILPDHPLYAIKKIRDAILDALIADPTRKAEFYILQADKHLNMAILLVEKGNTKYPQGTVQASVIFMEKAVKHLTKLKDEKRPIPGYISVRIANALEKHAQVYGELSSQTEGDLKNAVSKALDTIRQLQEQVKVAV